MPEFLPSSVFPYDACQILSITFAVSLIILSVRRAHTGICIMHSTSVISFSLQNLALLVVWEWEFTGGGFSVMRTSVFHPQSDFSLAEHGNYREQVSVDKTG